MGGIALLARHVRGRRGFSQYRSDRVIVRFVLVEVQPCLEFAFGVFDRATEVGESLAHGSSDLGKLLGSEHDERDYGNHHDLERTDLGHGASLRRAGDSEGAVRGLSLG
jgi:hypothetical protein